MQFMVHYFFLKCGVEFGRPPCGADRCPKRINRRGSLNWTLQFRDRAERNQPATANGLLLNARMALAVLLL